jgi:hypothetical protein
MQYRKKFTVEGVIYRFEVTDAGSVNFYVIGGGTDKAAFTPDWADDELDYGMQDRHYFKTGFKVFRRVQAILMEWVATKKPYAFFFTSNTDKKKPIYRYAAKKLAKSLTDYEFAESNDVFYFYRKAD